MRAVRARRMRRLLWASCALALGVTALLASCSGDENVTYGTAVFTMHDVSGGFSGFTNYLVDIDEIILTRNDGLVVEPLAEPEVVDLVKLHDLSELVEAPAVPIGTYTSMTLVLDYSAPYIFVDVDGVPTAAGAVDTSGDAFSSASIVVTFDPSNPLVISANSCVRLAIDLNLAASNTINYGTSPLTVTVQPIITATVAPIDQTVYRARGIYVVTQASGSDFIMNMRPFIDLVSALGALTVNVTDTTYFNIDGIIFTGAAGLAAMSKLQVSTPIAAYGTIGSFATITPTFNATQVYVGSALETPLADYVTGTVQSISGDNLVLLAPTYVSSIGDPEIFNSATVTVGATTIMNQDGVAASGLTTQSISVGQLVTIAGQGTISSTNVLTMDATEEGLLRLQPTPVWGTLKSAIAGSMSLDTLAFGGIEPSAYEFSGTGSSAANDAQPADYAVDTGTLDESATPTGTLLETFGFVTPFGSAPPDFTASSVTLGTATPQTLVVEWDNGGAASPFSLANSTGLVVNLANGDLSSTNSYIISGPQKTTLKSLPASPKIVFASGVTLTLSVGNDTEVATFNSPSGFATKLASTLDGSNLVYRLVCVGQYSSTANTFTASSVTVNLQE